MSEDTHRINRDERARDPDAETFTCEYCGNEYDDRARYERHWQREKREALKGNPIGDALLEADRTLRNEYR